MLGKMSPDARFISQSQSREDSRFINIPPFLLDNSTYTVCKGTLDGEVGEERGYY